MTIILLTQLWLYISVVLCFDIRTLNWLRELTRSIIERTLSCSTINLLLQYEKLETTILDHLYMNGNTQLSRKYILLHSKWGVIWGFVASEKRDSAPRTAAAASPWQQAAELSNTVLCVLISLSHFTVAFSQLVSWSFFFLHRWHINEESTLCRSRHKFYLIQSSHTSM